MNNIPHCCYLYWGGSSNMPLLMVFTVISFHRHNPDWEIIVYRTIQKNNDLGVNAYTDCYTGPDYFRLVEAMDFVKIVYIDVNEFGINSDAHSILGSDIFRTKILYQNGGLYSDWDVIWLRSIDDLLKVDCIGDANDFQCTVCYLHQTAGHHTVSNLIAEAGSSFLKSVIDFQSQVKPPYSHCGFSTFLLNEKYPELVDITSKFDRILALKYETFYPYSIFDISRLWLRDDLTPLDSKNVLCVHWFNGHPLSVEYTNRDKFEFQCSMTSILKKEGYI